MSFSKLNWKNPYLLLLVITVVGYFQIVFLQHPLKWDMATCSYPWRNLIGDGLQKHGLPWWNPYQNLGYPLHADPQSGAWYPIVWLIGYFYGYDIYSLSVEFSAHIFLAGIGMYQLCTVLKISRRAAFFSAASYLLCGFFIGNAQHFGFIISATWIPFVLAFYFKTEQTRSVYDALRTGFFLFLLLTGGYLAFAIILGYFLLALTAGYVISYFRSRTTDLLPGFIRLNCIILITALLLSSVFLVSVFSSLPYFTRGNGITLQQTLICPFSPQCSLSFLLPFAVISDPGFFATDLSMSNAFFGIIPLIFFLYSLSTAKTRLMKVFLIFGIFTLLAAFGGYVPVRAFLYYTVPLMNLFRIPSLFRLFAILSFVLLSGFAADHFLLEESAGPDSQAPDSTAPGSTGIRKLRRIALLLCAIVLAALVFAFSHGPLHLPEFFKTRLFCIAPGSTIYQHIALQSMVQLALLVLLLLLTIAIRERKILFHAMLLLSIADLVFAARLNAPYTLYHKEFDSAQVKKQSETFPVDYPLPLAKNTIAIADTGMGENSGLFFKNINTFYRQPAFDGYNPFFLKNLENLEDSFPDLFFSVLKNRTLFISGNCYPLDSIPGRVHRHQLVSTDVYLDSADFGKARTAASGQASSAEEVSITRFSPSCIRAKVSTTAPRLVTLLQNNYPGWTLLVNGKKTEIFTADFCFISALIPQGESEIEFSYSSKPVFAAFLVSATSLLVLVLVLLFGFINSRPSRVLD